ncbi:MAG: hypothetical protein ABIO02_01135 [Patescibacteria group bacterium]
MTYEHAVESSDAIYTELSPKEYWKELRLANEHHLAGLRNSLSELPLPLEGTAVIVVGSDAKFEKHPQSRPELVILSNTNAQPNILQTTYDVMHGKGKYLESFDTNKGDIEVKAVDYEVLSYAYGNPRAVYPDRILNAVVVAGDTNIYQHAREKVLKEMSGTGPTSKRIREYIKKQQQFYGRATNTGTVSNRPIFTLNPAQQFYDIRPEIYTLGFQISYLRTVQRYIDRLTESSIRKGKLELVETSKNMHTPTVDRIEYLHKMGIIPEQYSLQESYLWFLQQYNYAQEIYMRSGETAVVAFGEDNYAKYSQIIKKFTHSGLLNLQL